MAAKPLGARDRRSQVVCQRAVQLRAIDFLRQGDQPWLCSTLSPGRRCGVARATEENTRGRPLPSSTACPLSSVMTNSAGAARAFLGWFLGTGLPSSISQRLAAIRRPHRKQAVIDQCQERVGHSTMEAERDRSARVAGRRVRTSGFRMVPIVAERLGWGC